MEEILSLCDHYEKNGALPANFNKVIVDFESMIVPDNEAKIN